MNRAIALCQTHLLAGERVQSAVTLLISHSLGYILLSIAPVVMVAQGLDRAAGERMTGPYRPVPTVAERFLFAAANQDRLAHQLLPLHLDGHLSEAARKHAVRMARHSFISHQFEGELDLAARAGEAGAKFSLVTENVAEAPDSSEIHELWMHSAGHRANLMDPHVDVVGISVVEDRGEFFAVEDFAHTTQQLSFEQQEAEVGQLLASSGLKLDLTNEDARRTCQLITGYAGTRRPWFVMRYTSSDIHRLPEQLSNKILGGRYRTAIVGACEDHHGSPFSSYSIAVLLFP